MTRLDGGPERYLQIGAVARRTGLSLRTLRHYDEAGLVPPSGRSDGGFRLYSRGDVERLLLIRRMKPLGFSLEQMAHLLQAVSQRRDSPILNDLLTEARERREELANKLAMADELISMLESRAQAPQPDAPSPESPA